MNKALALMILTATGAAAARQPVPLMPPRLASLDAEPMVATRDQAPASEKDTIGFGVELGVVGRTNSAGGDIAGMDVFTGGRLVSLVPVWESLYLKPSLGYFMRGQGEGAANVQEKTFEGGVIAEYALLDGSGFKWLLGVSQRVDWMLSTISVSTASDTTSGLQYRVGPSTGAMYTITNDVSLTLDAETTFALTQPVRPYVGVTAGAVYRLP